MLKLENVSNATIEQDGVVLKPGESKNFEYCDACQEYMHVENGEMPHSPEQMIRHILKE